MTCAAAPAPWNAASCLSSSATRVARAWRSACLGRAHHNNLRLAPRFLYIGVGHCLLLLAADDLVEVVEARAREVRMFEDLGQFADGGVRSPAASATPS